MYKKMLQTSAVVFGLCAVVAPQAYCTITTPPTPEEMMKVITIHPGSKPHENMYHIQVEKDGFKWAGVFTAQENAKKEMTLHGPSHVRVNENTHTVDAFYREFPGDFDFHLTAVIPTGVTTKVEGQGEHIKIELGKAPTYK